ncbi:MAG: CDP-diacylglycerol--serine O-phosphatidyltransferase [Chlamydiae bacterium]|nr:MAG: CDP-diacylglycerol--serine O-phosphatidyltransferase [Chlamydiota bacterium]
MKIRKIKLKGTVYILPNLFTATNLALGIKAITLVLENEQHYKQAAECLILAMIFDVFDGLVARITKTTSQFGIEFDSLADLVSFGVAPAIMVYRYALSSGNIGKFGFLICVIYAGCAALRLARFNSRIEDETKSFSGIPTPAAAGVIATYFMLVGGGYIPNVMTEFIAHWILPFVTVALGVLMVSTVRFPAPAKQNIWRKHPFRYLAIAAGIVVLIIANRGITLFVIFTGYTLYGLINYIRQFFKHETEAEFEQEIDSEIESDADLELEPEETTNILQNNESEES